MDILHACMSEFVQRLSARGVMTANHSPYCGPKVETVWGTICQGNTVFGRRLSPPKQCAVRHSASHPPKNGAGLVIDSLIPLLITAVAWLSRGTSKGCLVRVETALKILVVPRPDRLEMIGPRGISSPLLKVCFARSPDGVHVARI